MNTFDELLDNLHALLKAGHIRITANRVLFGANKRVVANPGEVLTADQFSRAVKGSIKSLDDITVQRLGGYSN